METSDSPVGPSESIAQTGTSSSQSVQQKKDPAWEYAIVKENSRGRSILVCMFCRKEIGGRGLHRFKLHLAGKKRNVHPCTKVPSDIHNKLIANMEEHSKKTKEKKGIFDDCMSPPWENIIDVDLPSGSSPRKRKIAANPGIQKIFKHGVSDITQPSIKAALQCKERWNDTDLAIALWFYDAGIPMNAVNSRFFQPAVSKIASMGHGYTAPSYHVLRVGLLRDAKKHVELQVDSLRNTWSETGCSIMGDGWTDTRQRSLINFLVYCPKGITFVKSVDASDFVTNAQTLCNLFGEIVEWVSATNVVHLVTDNGSNYKSAGRLLTEKYPTITWSPCAAHCINLIMKDICEMPHVKNVAALASTVTVFVYNHKWTLNWLRKRPNWTEIVRPGATRFATTFIALKSLHDHKDDLQALVTTQEYKKCLKMPKGKEVKQIILDERFWNNSLIIVRVMAPLMRLLRICDSGEKHIMGYIYEGMYRARKGIKELFGNKKKHYKPYTKILKARWDNTLRQRLHAAAYWLNPAFLYDKKTFCNKPEVMNGVLDIIELQATCSKMKLLEETRIYKEREQSFSRSMAIESCKTTRPDEWWKLFGDSTPNLQKIAIKLLSQTTSSSGCERNWSTFEWIHSRRRNRLEHQRLNDLFYVHYNLRLQDRFKTCKRAYDPIDYESIDKTEFLVLEEDPSQDIEQEELEKFLEEEEEPICGDTQFDSVELESGSEANDANIEGLEVLRGGVDDSDDDWLAPLPRI